MESTLLIPGSLLYHGRKDMRKEKIIPLDYISRFIEFLQNDSTKSNLPFMFLFAPTGAGKTINFPMGLLQRSLMNVHIAVTEPRIVTTESSANTVAKLMNQPIGDMIGYTTGDSKLLPTNPNRSITFMTHTSLAPKFIEFVNDPENSPIPYNIIIIDEIHEMDQPEVMLLHKMLKDFIYANHNLPATQKTIIIFQTATIDAPRFCEWICSDMLLQGKYDYNNHIISVVGKKININSIMLKKPIGNGVEAIMSVLKTFAMPKKLNTLIFISDGSISTNIYDEIRNKHKDYAIYILSRLKLQKIPNIINDINNGKKPYIIVTTPVAQTGITFADLDLVIDDDTIFQPVYFSDVNSTMLMTLNIKDDIRRQRMGRVGRTKPGTYISLTGKELIDIGNIFPPAITYSDNLNTILDWLKYMQDFGKLASFNIEIDLFVPWPRNLINSGINELFNMGLIAPDLTLTDFGMFIQKIKSNTRLDLRQNVLIILSTLYNIDVIDLMFILKITSNDRIYNKIFGPVNGYDIITNSYQKLNIEKPKNLNSVIIDFCILRRYIEFSIRSGEKIDGALLNSLNDLLMECYILKNVFFVINIVFNNNISIQLRNADELIDY
ncbi:MAG: DEAD/DEAH box helicase, partial [Candidatus Riesia sp.]|nr:DEAD/DEAH box helicase [Candidatus Riesia sp.]